MIGGQRTKEDAEEGADSFCGVEKNTGQPSRDLECLHGEEAAGVC